MLYSYCNYGPCVGEIKMFVLFVCYYQFLFLPGAPRRVGSGSATSGVVGWRYRRPSSVVHRSDVVEVAVNYPTPNEKQMSVEQLENLTVGRTGRKVVVHTVYNKRWCTELQSNPAALSNTSK